MDDRILTFPVGSVLSSPIVPENAKVADAAIDRPISLGVVRSRAVRRIVRATPTLPVFEGELQAANTPRERVRKDATLMAMPRNGIDRIEDVPAMML